MEMIKKRELGMTILLTIVTCGLYGWYFIYKYAEDVNIMCNGDGKHTQGLLVYILLGVITCGIYTLFWYYWVGNRIQENGTRYGTEISDNGTTMLVFLILGSIVGIGWILIYIPMINSINKLADAYNSRNSLVEL